MSNTTIYIDAEPDKDGCCAICLERWSEESDSGHEVITTACGHTFHAACLYRLDQAAEQRYEWTTCPICRAEIPPVPEPGPALGVPDEDVVIYVKTVEVSGN